MKGLGHVATFASEEFWQQGRLMGDPRRDLSRVAWPYDNAVAESFMKTLKTEQVEGQAHRDLEHARGDIGAFIERVYNRQRLHSALAYRSPMEFEEINPAAWAAAHQARLPHTNCP